MIPQKGTLKWQKMFFKYSLRYTKENNVSFKSENVTWWTKKIKKNKQQNMTTTRSFKKTFSNTL